MLEEVANHPDAETRVQFGELLEDLLTAPRRTPGVLATKDGYPGMFTAPFDDALVVFQVMADHPLVDLHHVHWMKKNG